MWPRSSRLQACRGLKKLPSVSGHCGSMLWGYGIWWFCIVLLTTARSIRSECPSILDREDYLSFGVYSIATLALARMTHIGSLAVVGGFFITGLAGFWVLISARTLHRARVGYLSVSCCLVPGAIPLDRPEDR
jgi:hypothetical protein